MDRDTQDEIESIESNLRLAEASIAEYPDILDDPGALADWLTVKNRLEKRLQELRNPDADTHTIPDSTAHIPGNHQLTFDLNPGEPVSA